MIFKLSIKAMKKEMDLKLWA